MESLETVEGGGRAVDEAIYANGGVLMPGGSRLPWTAGSPYLGLAVGNVGLTCQAVFGALWGAPFAGLGVLMASIYLLRGDYAAAIPGGGVSVLPTGIGAVMLVCGVAVLGGLVTSAVALTTMHQHGLVLITRRPA